MTRWGRSRSGWPDVWTSGSRAAPASLCARWTRQRAARAQSRPRCEAYLQRGRDEHVTWQQKRQFGRRRLLFLALWEFVNQLSVNGFLFQKARAAWLCKWVVANSLWAPRVNGRSGMICYINPSLTRTLATVQLLESFVVFLSIPAFPCDFNPP